MLKAYRVPVRTVMEVDNIETIKRSMEVGMGISILPEPTVVNEVRGGLLRTIPLAEGPLTRTIGIIHRRGRMLPAASAEFVRVLTSQVERKRIGDSRLTEETTQRLSPPI